ncbi:MAG TPA: ferritin [Armatimonadota bacterium]|nr:ferritin [Armatimonadota bacterium]
MISDTMQDALNDQMNFELFSAYLYLSMSAYFQSLNLPGFANWMHVQAQEEMVHVMKFYNFILGRGGRVLLKTIDGPQTDWSAPIAPFEDAYAHEQKVTARINNLINLAIDERDHATNAFLQWFVTEQVEEESNVDAVVRQLRLVGEDKSGLFMIDRELGTRVFVPPATGGQGAA